MQPRFNPPEGGYDAELLCPNCGDTHLHHEQVEVFERNEDETTGLHVVVEAGKVTIDRRLAGNPSGRRHGLRIYFWCEGCSARPALTLAQHKGNTFVDFTFEDES